MPWKKVLVFFRDVLEEAGVKPPGNILDFFVANSYSIICFAMSMILMVLVCAATICRYILEIDLYGYEEWAKLFAFWLYFLGAGLGAYNSSHVTADVVQAYVKPGFVKNLLVFIKSLVTVVVTFLFTWYGVRFMMYGMLGPLGTGVGMPKTSLWNLPFWFSYLAIFLGFVTMSWYFLKEFIKATRTLFATRGVAE